MTARSIRLRLPLTYAAIGLLAVLILGVVMLTVLRDHYTSLEEAQFLRNARAIASALSEPLQSPDAMTEEGLKALQAQVESLAFLAQARVRVLGGEAELLADSGPVLPSRIRLVREERDPFFWFSIVAQPGEALPARSSLGTESIIGGAALPRLAGRLPDRADADAEGDSTDLSPTRVITSTFFSVGSGLRVAGSLFGFDLGADALYSIARSEQVVRMFVRHDDGLSSTVEVSDGPSYSRGIVKQAAWGWGIAGAVAVGLAAGAGYLISKGIARPLLHLTGVTKRMTEGDLSVRANVSSRDEVGLLARSFNRMAEQVEETVAMLRRFASDAAHEIRTPMTALHTDLEMAAEAQDGEESRALAQRALTQLARLESLTASLLELSRIESLEAAMDQTSLDMATLVRGEAERYASQAEQLSLSFSLQVPVESVIVQGNALLLGRAIDNLLENALKFTPAGGTVMAGLRCRGAWAEVWVEDSGIGIPPDDLPQLFNRFHRGSNASAFPGSGLGLTMVKAIAERHGGSASAANVAQGARFELRLPLCSSPDGDSGDANRPSITR